MLKNRRGISIEALLAMVVGVLVLVVVGYGFYLHYERGVDFFEYLPSFGFSGEEQIELGVLGYNLESGTVEYFDGVSWEVLEGDFEIRDKKFNTGSVENEFLRFWRSGREESVLRIIGLGDKIYSDDFSNFPTRNGVVVNNIAVTSSGEVVSGDLVLDAVEPEEICGTFSLDVKERLSFQKWELNKNDLKCEFDISEEKIELANLKRDIGDDYDKIIEFMIEWRDSVLENPIELNGNWYCVEKIDVELVVDLGEEVLEGEKC
jgi:hypothetical protein